MRAFQRIVCASSGFALALLGALGLLGSAGIKPAFANEEIEQNGIVDIIDVRIEGVDTQLSFSGDFVSTWNPNTHTWQRERSSGNWTDNSVSYKISNHSTVPVSVVGITASENGYTIAPDSLGSTTIAAPSSESAEAPWTIISFSASGTPTENLTYTSLVRISVTPITCDHVFTDTITAPTCTERGYTTHTCTKCSRSYVDSYTDALGHSFGEWVVVREATEETAGEMVRTCVRCPETETGVIPPLTHKHTLSCYGLREDTQPTIFSGDEPQTGVWIKNAFAQLSGGLENGYIYYWYNSPGSDSSNYAIMSIYAYINGNFYQLGSGRVKPSKVTDATSVQAYAPNGSLVTMYGQMQQSGALYVPIPDKVYATGSMIGTKIDGRRAAYGILYRYDYFVKYKANVVCGK